MDAWEAAADWAVVGHVADRHARQLKESFASSVQVEEQAPQLVNAAEHELEGPQSWDAFIGQDRVKVQLRIHIDSALKRGKALDHVLLASGMPGVGKTTLAHLVAKEMGAYLMKLVPPFHKDTLVEAATELGDGGVLFIDEIHKMADNGPQMAELLLHALEEGRMYTNDGAKDLADITIIGATTDAGKLPETILDRFVIKPHFEAYTVWDLSLITAQFAGRYGAPIDDEVIVSIAAACRGVPRVARELVMAGRDLSIHYGRSCTSRELFEFKQMDPDGTTVAHRHYLLALYRNFGRKSVHGVEYIAGESSLRKVLRETKGGLENLERFLLEQGLIDQTPSGRRLTAEGIEKARRFDAEESR